MKAYEVLETYDWCKGAYARDEDDKECSPGNETATKFCALGAIMRAYDELGVNSVWMKLEESIGYIQANQWNDAQTSKEPVIAKLKELNI